MTGSFLEVGWHARRRATRHATVVTGYVGLMLGAAGHEAHEVTLMEVDGFVRSEAPVIVGSVVTGPLYGALGQRWTTRRAWASAVFVAGAVCFEPLAECAFGQLPSASTVWQAEIGVGIVMGIAFVTAGIAYRKRSRRLVSSP